jgi:hypothetical protein
VMRLSSPTDGQLEGTARRVVVEGAAEASTSRLEPGGVGPCATWRTPTDARAHARRPGGRAILEAETQGSTSTGGRPRTARAPPSAPGQHPGAAVPDSASAAVPDAGAPLTTWRPPPPPPPIARHHASDSLSSPFAIRRTVSTTWSSGTNHPRPARRALPRTSTSPPARALLRQ